MSFYGEDTFCRDDRAEFVYLKEKPGRPDRKETWSNLTIWELVHDENIWFSCVATRQLVAKRRKLLLSHT